MSVVPTEAALSETATTADTSTEPTMLDFARAYIGEGWRPIPVAYRAKRPSESDWQTTVIDETNVEAYFGSGLTNIGILLGSKSGNLVDVDIDDDVALRLAKGRRR